MHNNLKSTTGNLRASSTCVEQAQFPGFENLQFPPRAAVVSKRSPGRPRGSRGFVFPLPVRGAVRLLETAQYLHGEARKQSVTALWMRRQHGERSHLAHSAALHGRAITHAALACVLAGFLSLRGGVL